MVFVNDIVAIDALFALVPVARFAALNRTRVFHTLDRTARYRCAEHAARDRGSIVAAATAELVPHDATNNGTSKRSARLLVARLVSRVLVRFLPALANRRLDVDVADDRR